VGLFPLLPAKYTRKFTERENKKNPRQGGLKREVVDVLLGYDRGGEKE
jgi:hypothetical protein